MANTINLATLYLPKFEEKLTLGELTKDLNKNPFSWDGGNSVKVAIPELKGFASYTRTGYKDGEFNLTWQQMILTQDRYIKVGIDEMDDNETQKQAVASAMSDVAIEATEEMDAYRLGTIASNSKASSKAEDLTTADAIETAISLGEANEINAKGRLQDCVLYISASKYMVLKNKMAYRFLKGQDVDQIFETYDEMKLLLFLIEC